jgi:Na+-transporting methylmalonyl-CoA/oxaloacetate decarboxylase gamma subunit
MVDKLLPDGLKLLIVGQTAVLSFIGAMILTMKLIAWAVKAFEKPMVAAPQPVILLPVPEIADEDESLAAALAVAVHRKRNEQ